VGDVLMLQKITNFKKLYSDNGKIVFDYDMYMGAIEAISTDILNSKALSSEEVGLVGIARGALPMLTSVSHFTGKRRVSVIQNKMTNSDNCYDYGKVVNLSINLSDEFKKYILLEDIVYRGQTIGEAVRIIESIGSEVEAIYSLVADENAARYSKLNIPVKYCYDLEADQWVHFLWETNINKRMVRSEG
jgi:orotate phosphoribosyltransferase